MNQVISGDADIAKLIDLEAKRQSDVLMMIPSENYASDDVRQALGSVLTNKYSEGYPHKRYYQGNLYIDEIEDLAISRAKSLFGVPYANVQSYSGSPANAAVYFALLSPGDVIMGLKLSGGGHLTHGHPDITFSGKYFRSHQYDVELNGMIDYEKLEETARMVHPKIIVAGTTAYPRTLDWAKFRKIADLTGALLLADISHIAGLVVGNVHPSPVPYADIVMTTTHKTLRGPRGAIIMVTERGLKHDSKMGEKIDKAVFPGLQGGPHNNVTAAIAVALFEAAKPQFKLYAKCVVDNATVLSHKLMSLGLTLTTGGTDNHLMVIDLRPEGLSGTIAAEALEVAGIIVNKNSVPHDTNPPFYPSGIRLGTPALTTRGMGQNEMEMIAGWINQVIKLVKIYKLPLLKEERSNFFTDTRKKLAKDKELLAIAGDVKAFCQKFPLHKPSDNYKGLV